MSDPETEGIKYAGSKRKLIPYILKCADLLQAETVFDGFSGTTRVSQSLKKTGHTVYANDTAVWSKVLGQCYLLNETSESQYEKWIDHLNNLNPKEGWFTKHYGGSTEGDTSVGEDGKKKMWQNHVTRKLDAIRPEIDNLTEDEVERSVLLTSLLLALDKVDNTVGHQTSYLKNWSARSHDDLELEVPDISVKQRPHEVYQRDSIELASEVEADLAYYDPPYGSSNEDMPSSRVRYSAYYHLWKTICLNDEPEVFGAANRREDSRDRTNPSVFESYERDEDGRFEVVKALKELLSNTQCDHILLSYSNKGRATPKQIEDVLYELSYSYEILKIPHSENPMKQMSSTEEWVQDGEDNIELLFAISQTGRLPPFEELRDS